MQMAYVHKTEYDLLQKEHYLINSYLYFDHDDDILRNVVVDWKDRYTNDLLHYYLLQILVTIEMATVVVIAVMIVL